MQSPRIAAGAWVGAALAAIAVLLSGRVDPIPSLIASASFLFLAVGFDLASRKIPNALTLPALIVVWLGQAGGLLELGLGTSLLGALVVFAALFVTYAMGWLGAGDVKAAVVLAALWGYGAFFGVFWWMVVVGGVLAVALIAWRGEFPDLLRRWWMSLKLSVITRRLHYEVAAASSAARSGLPFALCMALGTVAFQIWGAPWQ